MRILIVDDNFVSRKLLKTILDDLGVCDLAESGEEALDLFTQAHATQNPYSVICLDQMMPGMSGQDVLESIRGFESENKIDFTAGAKILMVTADDQKKSILSSFRKGVAAYIIKPIERKKVTDAIANLNL